MKKPLISIILPAYNASLFVSSSIESILNQTFKDFELIILNDGSTDNTKEIILSKNDKRIRYFEHKSNLGLIKTLNKGLYMSNAKFIARMDADDISMVNRLETQYAFMLDNKEVDILGSNMKFSGVASDRNFAYDNEHHKIWLMSHNTISHPTVMLRKNSLNYQNLYYEMAHN